MKTKFFLSFLSTIILANQALGYYTDSQGNVHLGEEIFSALEFAAGAACLCAPNIQGSFSSTQSTISSKLSSQKSALTKLKGTLENLNKEMDFQNKFLEQDNILLKEKILKDMELIFYLKQRNELK